jgi:class 3 adenylate cyclase
MRGVRASVDQEERVDTTAPTGNASAQGEVVGEGVSGTGTVTFMFTDIEGSTNLLKVLGRARYAELLADHQRLLRDVLVEHRGQDIKTEGDAFFVTFHDASDAVSAAIAIQRALAAHSWPNALAVRVRIGLHTGEAASAGDSYIGLSVHRAARIGAVGHGGQVLLSSPTRELVENDLPEGVSLRGLGLYRLKDIDSPERLSQLVIDGSPTKFPALKATAVRCRHLWVLQDEEHFTCLHCKKTRSRRKRLLCYLGLHNWILMHKPMHMIDKADERYLACRHCGKYGGSPGQPWIP